MQRKYFISLFFLFALVFSAAGQDSVQIARKEIITYYQNGQTNSIIHQLPDGRWDGEYVKYDESGSGNIILKENYKNGMHCGKTEGYVKGIISYKGEYDERGMKSGEWIFYNEKGEVRRIFIYEANVIKDEIFMDADGNRLIGHYTSITEALKNPDAVYYLDLRSQRLRRIPEEVTQFKNLRFLNLSAFDKSEMPKWKRHDSIAQYKSKGPHDPPAIHDFVIYPRGPYKRNRIRKIPEGLSTLKELRLVDVSDTKMTAKQVHALKKKLPRQCEILGDVD